MTPKVSVVLPVYNDVVYIKEAIQSILAQTFSDFELLIINDRSTDDIVAVVNTFEDERIRLYTNDRNLGRAGSDNFALSVIKGVYIAKMDSDDICHPQRLEKQVQFLEKNTDVNVVGAWMQNFGYSNYLNKYPEAPSLAKCMTLFTLPVGNPSILLRSSIFSEKGMVYNAALRQTEDYDFFARYIDQLSIVTLPEPLILYRTYPDKAKEQILSERHATANYVRKKLLENWGIPASEQEIDLHNRLAHLDQPLAPYSLDQANIWLHKLYEYNKKNPLFDDKALLTYLSSRWFDVCYLHPYKKLRSISSYYKADLRKYYKISNTQKLKFFFKSLANF